MRLSSLLSLSLQEFLRDLKRRKECLLVFKYGQMVVHPSGKKEQLKPCSAFKPPSKETKYPNSRFHCHAYLFARMHDTTMDGRRWVYDGHNFDDALVNLWNGTEGKGKARRHHPGVGITNRAGVCQRYMMHNGKSASGGRKVCVNPNHYKPLFDVGVGDSQSGSSGAVAALPGEAREAEEGRVHLSAEREGLVALLTERAWAPSREEAIDALDSCGWNLVEWAGMSGIPADIMPRDVGSELFTRCMSKEGYDAALVAEAVTMQESFDVLEGWVRYVAEMIQRGFDRSVIDEAWASSDANVVMAKLWCHATAGHSVDVDATAGIMFVLEGYDPLDSVHDVPDLSPSGGNDRVAGHAPLQSKSRPVVPDPLPEVRTLLMALSADPTHVSGFRLKWALALLGVVVLLCLCGMSVLM